MSENDSGDANQALRYASGEMDATEAAAFERRLGEDQSLREALCRTVEWMQTLEGRAPLVPSPAYRQRVRDRLRPGGGWWRRLMQRRTYRGHPVLWSGLGAAAALLMALAWPSASLPGGRPSVEPLVKEQFPRREPEAPHAAPAGPDTIEMAETWASLPNSDHLVRAVEEENRRRDRLTRDDHVFHLPIAH